jgi:Pyruvate kinase
MNKYLKKTKIIATLGPASSSKEVMLGLMKAGVDIFRINFSHADYDLVRKILRSSENLIRNTVFP